MRYDQEIQMSYRFPVHFVKGLFEPGKRLLKRTLKGSRGALFYLDRGVAKHHPKLKGFIEKEYGEKVYLVKGGEAVKNEMGIVEKVGGDIRKRKLDRHGAVVIIGGGAVIDAVGFAASITHRGMRQIRVPTTVLSQNDSGIGVKNGVNGFGAKNYFGTFAPPSAVINDVTFLSTLPDRDWVSGISEAFKVGLIKDSDFYGWLCKNAMKLRGRNMNAMRQLVKRCAILHLDHIREGGDPFETGSSRPLDFGHWSAHKLEVLTGNRLRHGEAVAVGISLDLYVAGELGFLSVDEIEQTLGAIKRSGLPVWHQQLENPKLLEGIEEFREHIGGELCLTLPQGIGRRIEINNLPEDQVLRCVAKLKAWAKRAK